MYTCFGQDFVQECWRARLVKKKGRLFNIDINWLMTAQKLALAHGQTNENEETSNFAWRLHSLKVLEKLSLLLTVKNLTRNFLRITLSDMFIHYQ